MPELQLGAAVRWGAEPAAPSYAGDTRSGWPLSIKKYQVSWMLEVTSLSWCFDCIGSAAYQNMVLRAAVMPGMRGHPTLCCSLLHHPAALAC
jgi:hypothetical protein